MDDLHLIEQYLLGKLPAPQLKEFHDRLQSDTEFSKLFEQENLIFRTVQDKASQNFLDKVDAVIAMKVASDEKRSPFINRYVWLAAAAVILLFGLFYFGSEDLTTDELFATHFEPYPMVLSQRGDQESVIRDLINAYDAHQWHEVIKSLDFLPEKVLPSELNDLYVAVAYLGAYSPKQAIAKLEKYSLRSAGAMMQPTILWYLSLAQIQSGDRLKAKETLTALAALNGEKSLIEKAAKLSRQL